MAWLEVDDLRVAFGGREVVRGIGFSLDERSNLTLLGASGSGKSLTVSAILGTLPPDAGISGSVKVGGREVLGVRAAQRDPDARVAGVFQDSSTSLNPLVRVGNQLAEPVLRSGEPAHQVRGTVCDLLESVGIRQPPRVFASYPAELSGGERQRVCIALALASQQRLVIADEPTTALDVVTQAQVLQVIKDRFEDRSSVLFVTHDLAAGAKLSDDVLVMEEGRIIERGPIRALAEKPVNDFTRRLVSAAGTQTRRHALTVAENRRAMPPAPRKARTVFECLDVSRRYRSRGRRIVDSLDEVSLTIAKGERVGVVGASGAGKSTLLRMILALDASTSGAVLFGDAPLWPGSSRALKAFRSEVQYVPQDPASSLDPRKTVRQAVSEPLRMLRRVRNRSDVDRAVTTVLERVGIDAAMMRRRPQEISGGQAQRVAIARAIVTEPQVLVADEPVSGLDLPLRIQITEVLRSLSDDLGMGLVLVSHDLSIVAELCDRVLVMEGGRLVEDASTADLMRDPASDAGRALLDALPGALA